MKKFAILLLLAFGLMLSSNSSAQNNVKLGHVDFATLYSMMPGLDSVRILFENYNKNVQEQFAAMQTE